AANAIRGQVFVLIWSGRSAAAVTGLIRSCRSRARGARNAGGVDSDLVDARPRSEIQTLQVGVAEPEVCGPLRHENGSQMLALRRDDPHAAGPGGPDVSLGVDLRSVGDAGCFVAREVDDQLRIRQGAIGLDVVPADVILAAAVHAEVVFV